MSDQEDIQPFEWLTSPSSLRPILTTLPEHEPKRAIHIGSGSSIVGEFLVKELGYELVLDVDKDEEALIRMRRRWHDYCVRVGEDPSRLQHLLVDFTQDKIPEAMDASFGLILDKGTLDCTLCSDNGTASMLVEIYRCLSVGGAYVVISLHEPELLLPLLTDLPGTDWEVTCQTMARRVERLDGSDINGMSCEPTSSHHPPLSVLTARKLSIGLSQLDPTDIGDHVRHINDVWFQESRPLLNHQRQEELRTSFLRPLPPQEAYQYLFTETEREDLTYDYFLQDWDAFLKLRHLKEELITFDIAVDFLTVMQ